MDLIAIGYPETLTAGLAMEDLEAISRDRAIRRDEIAVIVRDEGGLFTSTTGAEISGGEPTWGMFWGALFATLFYVPLLGMRVGPDLAPIVEDIERSGLDPVFADRVRGMMVPGTSALFVLLPRTGPDIVVTALEVYGGTVLQCEVSRRTERVLEDVFSGHHEVA